MTPGNNSRDSDLVSRHPAPNASPSMVPSRSKKLVLSSKPSMPNLLAASARMELAKRAWTRAAQAAIRGLPLALAQSITSLEERNVASAALAKASGKASGKASPKASDTPPNPTRRQSGATSPTTRR